MPVLNVYNELIPFEEVGGDMVSRISDLNIYDVFQPIIEEYKDKPEHFNKVLFYILHTYSKESRFVIVGQSPLLEKERIADRLNIHDHAEEDDWLRTDCIHLRNVAILKTVQRYLRLQVSKPLEHLMMKRELYQQMLLSAMDDIKDGNGVIMYDQKYKNSGYADKLYDNIYEWEQKLLNDFKELKGAIEEMRERAKSSNKTSLRVEDFIDDKDE